MLLLLPVAFVVTVPATETEEGRRDRGRLGGEGDCNDDDGPAKIPPPVAVVNVGLAAKELIIEVVVEEEGIRR